MRLTQNNSIPQTLFFAINDVTKGDYKKKYYAMSYNRTMVKFMIFGSDIKSSHWLHRIYFLLKPFFTIPILTVMLLVINLIIKPVKFIFRKRS